MARARLTSPSALGVRLTRPWTQPLYVHGEVRQVPRVAIVGSRAARTALRRFVPSLVAAVRRAQFGVVSGGAIGIDGDAHREALRQGVPQVAVLPGACDSFYPPQHKALFEAMLGSGNASILACHPPGTKFARGMFASRNRLVVGLAERLIVVQAGLRSGTQLTAKIAARERLSLAALGGSAGAAACIASGAICLGQPGDTLEEVEARTFAWLRGEATPAKFWPAQLDFIRQRFADGSKMVSVDNFDDPLAAACGLVEAEGLGLVCEVGAGQYAEPD